ncbi:MAG: ABC transporter permease [Cocleimonas sp.]
MTSNVATISLTSLLLLLIPVALVLWIQFKWLLNYKEGAYSIVRMLGQLVIIGYFLGYIFNAQSAWVIVLVLCVMVIASSWIALRTVKVQRQKLFSIVLFSLLVGGGSILALVTQGVLQIDPWFSAKIMIPMAGMIFSNALNAISLAAERFSDEQSRGEPYEVARNIAFRTAMIPIINSLFAVGLVSLPGMMTGQILSGVDPLIAARYQILVMAMIFASGGIASAMYLTLIKKYSST